MHSIPDDSFFQIVDEGNCEQCRFVFACASSPRVS